MNENLLEFDARDPLHIDAVAELWNGATPAELAISSRFVRYNVSPVQGRPLAGRMAMRNGEAIGVVFVSAITGELTGSVELLVVHPAWQRQGIGHRLLNWAEAWLAQQRCTQIQLGAGIKPFAPGLPSTLNAVTYFQHRGYGDVRMVWDVAANLAHYTTPETVREIPGAVRPAQPGDEAALAAFLAREFPGRWRLRFQEFCRLPDYRLSDYMVLWTERGIDGFCCLTFEDSQPPIERYYPYTLPRPWGQLGPIGVSANARGRGYGAALMDAGLRRLHNNGINGCVIDWTTLLEFYGKFGFQPYREYVQLAKQLSP
ncbi:MAG: GNAT family N-acetyltransferase [Caldilineaceae bacterium]